MKKPRKKKGPDADNISRRQRAFKHGRRAEAYARWLLRANGDRVVARNFRHPLGEVDLIVMRGRLVIFVEVKSRADLDAGPYAVSPAQWRRISAGTSDLLRAIHIMWALSVGLTCLLSAETGVSAQ